ncbi:phage major capsid protein [Streptomyces sp. NPDC088789]|uniref:phage major capsid protein n=1 Tax=Streptomyces sp. NPDC088789 TaxID=3365899 RepID=UPI0037F1FA72
MSTLTIRSLKAQRTKLGAEAQAVLEGAARAGRSMTGEENETFDRIMAERDGLDDTISRAERLVEDERATVDDLPGPEREDATVKAFRSYLVHGRAALTEQQARALNAGHDPEGGFLIAPKTFVTDLLQRVDDQVPMRGLATVQRLTQAESLGVPTLETDLNDAEWTSEIGTGSQDDALRFGERELSPNPLAKQVRISRKLLRLASTNPETIVRDRLAHKFGVTQEKAYMTGDGNKKPLGVFTASTDGISTARDVSTGAATGFTGDGLIDAKYALKAQYWQSARWLFHRYAIRDIRKLKDGNGQYLWQPGLTGGAPDTIIDQPYIVSEFVPNTFTTGQYVGMFGDFSHYWIVDSLAFEIQRLVELYATSNQIGLIGRLESDGMPVMEEAFVRLKTA